MLIQPAHIPVFTSYFRSKSTVVNCRVLHCCLVTYDHARELDNRLLCTSTGSKYRYVLGLGDISNDMIMKAGDGDLAVITEPDLLTRCA